MSEPTNYREYVDQLYPERKSERGEWAVAFGIVAWIVVIALVAWVYVR